MFSRLRFTLAIRRSKRECLVTQHFNNQRGAAASEYVLLCSILSLGVVAVSGTIAPAFENKLKLMVAAPQSSFDGGGTLSSGDSSQTMDPELATAPLDIDPDLGPGVVPNPQENG